MIKVRLMEDDDISSVAGMGQDYHAESFHSHTDYNKDTVEALLKSDIMRKDGVSIVALDDGGNIEVPMRVDKDDGDVIGITVGLAHPSWYGSGIDSGNLCHYVRKEHRGSHAAILMLSMYEQEMAKKGVVDLKLDINSGIKMDRGCKFMKGMGFEPAGYKFIKTIGV